MEGTLQRAIDDFAAVPHVRTEVCAVRAYGRDLAGTGSEQEDVLCAETPGDDGPDGHI
jgi:hypothetical protein